MTGSRFAASNIEHRRALRPNFGGFATAATNLRRAFAMLTA
jgi:hypothetical protein